MVVSLLSGELSTTSSSVTQSSWFFGLWFLLFFLLPLFIHLEICNLKHENRNVFYTPTIPLQETSHSAYFQSNCLKSPVKLDQGIKKVGGFKLLSLLAIYFLKFSLLARLSIKISLWIRFYNKVFFFFCISYNSNIILCRCPVSWLANSYWLKLKSVRRLASAGDTQPTPWTQHEYVVKWFVNRWTDAF